MNKIYNTLEKYLFKEMKYATKQYFRPIKLIFRYIIQREEIDVVCDKRL